MKSKQHIKWIINDVKFTRGNHTPLIAKFDNSRTWLELRACCTAQTFKAEIRRLAQEFGAKEIEVKPEYIEDESGNYHKAETLVIGFLYIDDKAFFATDVPVPEGARRKINEFKPEEIFISK